LRSQAEVRELVGDDDLWRSLVERPLGEVLKATFINDTVRGIVATDALIGTFASLHDPGLAQNICFLYHLIGGGTGDWDVPVGGMGALTDSLAKAAVSAGAELLTGTEVTAVDPSSGEVAWTGGRATGSVLHAACAPAVLNRLLAAADADPVPTEPDVEGAQLKVNMVLTRLPRLRDTSVDPAAAFAGTFHINEGYQHLEAAHTQALAGRIPDLPPCEIYCHTLSDRSILGPDLVDTEAQTVTLFGLHLPARLFRGDNEATRAAALEATIRSLDSVLAEPISDVLARDAQGRPCLEVKTPVDLEQAVGLPGGNIFHRTLQWPWAERATEVGTWGVETPYPNLTIAGAGARRGGGVSGIPGHNAAARVLTG
jgi:phytoene dehydrogenase-like protein